MQSLTSYLPLVIIVLLFYFLLLRPQQKKQRDRQNLLNALGEGDTVVTIGGLHGVIATMDDKTVTLRINDDTKVVFDRSAISSVREKSLQ